MLSLALILNRNNNWCAEKKKRKTLVTSGDWMLTQDATLLWKTIKFGNLPDITEDIP